MKRQLIFLLTGIALVGLLAIPTIAAASQPKEVYEVVSPLGEISGVKAVPLTPRLATLSGKTVCELYSSSFRGDVTFPIIRELLQKRYRDLKVIPYTEFPETVFKGVTEGQMRKMRETIVAMMLKKGCNAVIAGNGG